MARRAAPPLGTAVHTHPWRPVMPPAQCCRRSDLQGVLPDPWALPMALHGPHDHRRRYSSSERPVSCWGLVHGLHCVPLIAIARCGGVVWVRPQGGKRLPRCLALAHVLARGAKAD